MKEQEKPLEQRPEDCKRAQSLIPLVPKDEFFMNNIICEKKNYQVFEVKPKNFTISLEVVGAFIECNSQYLLLYRSEDKKQGKTWCLPGGKVEKSESLESAVIRETYEETKITLKPQGLKKIGQLFIRHESLKDYVFHIYYQKLSFPQKVHLSPEHQHYCWQDLKAAKALPLIDSGKESLEYFERQLYTAYK